MRWSWPAQSVKLLHRLKSTPRSAGEGRASLVICGAHSVLRSAGENRGFPFPRPAPYVCDDPVTAWDWSLEDATVARAQITHHDATICHHYPESLRDGLEILDRLRDGSTTLAQSVGLEEGVNCISG